MAYVINHVHIRSADPRASAAWYEKHFDAKIVSEREVMPGTIT
ncbi:MAG: VOC family protein, partial [Dehalococcoidia bacterium]|nr:VOC family protein [Dehalococcoidia bacterium]